MTRLNKLTALAAAVALSVGLAACGGGGSSTSMIDAPEPTPTPEPTPDTGVVDLAAAQEATMAAASAAMAASDAAATSAAGAATATANVATLQTGEMAQAHAMAASSHAETAAVESGKAAAANTAAQAATTGSAAGAQLQIAQTAQAAAEAAAMKAAEYAMKAAEAAMTELHIDGTMKSAAGSSLDARSGTLKSQDDQTQTGYISSVSRDVDMIDGVPFDQRGDTADAAPTNDTTDNAMDVAYVQAVAAGSADIGKVLDTSDDMARLTIVIAREGKEDVRVFADMAADATAEGLLESAGTLADLDGTTEGTQTASVKSIGSYYMATPPDNDSAANMLDAMDVVDPASDPVELFELSGTVNDDAKTRYARVTVTRTDGTGEVTGRTYREVDITAFAALDSPADGDNNPEQVQVTASIPTAEEYSHIHFGVWAGLMDNEDGDNSVLANLGIGFVQNHDDSGVTTGHVTGTATYSGDWVAVVRPMHSSALASADGHATLTANFSEGEFTGALDGLATLEGSLSGNTFSGTDATVTHADMDASGDFAGSFSGAIYGSDGAEAAGVFSFDGADAGAFVGAFGGRDDDQ